MRIGYINLERLPDTLGPRLRELYPGVPIDISVVIRPDTDSHEIRVAVGRLRGVFVVVDGDTEATLKAKLIAALKPLLPKLPKRRMAPTNTVASGDATRRAGSTPDGSERRDDTDDERC